MATSTHVASQDEGAGGSFTYTLPSRLYSDPSVYEEEKQKIFYKTWQYIAHVSSFKEPGDYVSRDIAGQPVFVIRDQSGELRAFFNVCQHRGHRLLNEDGNCKRIVCPYHAWTYHLDGRLLNARATVSSQGFNSESIRLKEIAVEQFCGFVFVNLMPDPPSLKSITGDLEEEVWSYAPQLNELRLVGETLLEHNCNWKVSVENYNECYHCAVVHKTFVSQIVSMGDSFQLVPDGITIRHYTKGQAADTSLYKYNPDRGKSRLYATWFIWPNVALNVFPGGIVSVRHFRPMGWRTTVYSYQWFCDEEASDEVVKDLMETHARTNGAEDCAIVDSVQCGLESLGYDRGPLVVNRATPDRSEHGIAHLNELYLKAMGGTGEESVCNG